MNEGVLIVAIGRPALGDDAVGILVGGKVRDRIGALARVLLDTGSGWEALEAVDQQGLLILIDAAEETGSLPAGCWCRIKFPEHAEAIACCKLRDTHTLGIASMLKMGEKLGRLPPEVWIYAIAGERFAPETDPSPSVGGIIDRVADRIASDVRSWLEKRNRLHASRPPN